VPAGRGAGVDLGDQLPAFQMLVGAVTGQHNRRELEADPSVGAHTARRARFRTLRQHRDLRHHDRLRAKVRGGGGVLNNSAPVRTAKLAAIQI